MMQKLSPSALAIACGSADNLAPGPAPAPRLGT
jgi:hypothetical protein